MTLDSWYNLLSLALCLSLWRNLFVSSIQIRQKQSRIKWIILHICPLCKRSYIHFIWLKVSSYEDLIKEWSYISQFCLKGKSFITESLLGERFLYYSRYCIYFLKFTAKNINWKSFLFLKKDEYFLTSFNHHLYLMFV